MFRLPDFYDDLTTDSSDSKQAKSSAIYYALPKVGRQNDGWSCGLNSGAKFLRYHGMATNYSINSKLFSKKRNDG